MKTVPWKTYFATPFWICTFERSSSNVTLMNKLKACEMCLYKKILKIPLYSSHITTEVVLHRIGSERKLLHDIQARKVSYLWHLLRNKKYEMAQLIMKSGSRRKQRNWQTTSEHQKMDIIGCSRAFYACPRPRQLCHCNF